MMALLAAMALAPMVAGQVLTPDEYRTCNVPPSSNDTVDVYTSALLERLIDVNDRAVSVYDGWFVSVSQALPPLLTFFHSFSSTSSLLSFSCTSAGRIPPTWTR